MKGVEYKIGQKVKITEENWQKIASNNSARLKSSSVGTTNATKNVINKFIIGEIRYSNVPWYLVNFGAVSLYLEDRWFTSYP